MTAGSKTYKGLAVPLWGESTIRQVVAATDILTFQLITGATGKAINVLDSGGSSVYSVSAAGAVTASGAGSVGTRLTIGTVGAPTTAPTTGLTKGQMFLVWKSATHPVLAMCVSQATQLVQYIAGFNADTLGIAS